MKKLNAVARFSVALLAIFCLAITAAAQIQNGQFTGTVTDPSGAAVPNAKVTALNPGTNFTVAANTNNAGVYTVRELPIGTYKLTVEAPGFKTSSKSAIEVNAGVTFRFDFKLEVGGATEIIEVTEDAAPVNTVDSKLTTTVGGAQLANLPLNGRNVFDLIQLAPGAVNVTGVMFEQGTDVIVNGARQNFNGFLINGVANKQLSGGANTTPIQDSVAEFQLLTLNNSAQYGNSAGAITNLVTKSGTNSYHGSAWEFLRNDIFDANNFFLNQQGIEKQPLRFNQFGGTFGGPIIKDKLFFFASGQGDRFTTAAPPTTISIESPEWVNAVQAAFPNSVSNLLYQTFPITTPSTLSFTLDDYVAGGFSGSGFGSIVDYLCQDNTNVAIAANMQAILGVTAIDQANMAGCSVIPGLQAGTVGVDPVTGLRNLPFLLDTSAVFKSRTRENLFNGNEASIRVDYNATQNDRLFGQYNYFHSNDEFTGGPTGPRGFTNPVSITGPNFQISYIKTFSPTVLNEFKAGYAGNTLALNTDIAGVPAIGITDGTVGFGSYNGYPQFFKENIYTYADMVSMTKGNHNLKFGGDVRRNIENSEFNVGRPSYYFFDSLFFAVDAPYIQIAGVDPGITSGQPAQLSSNIRHWRNWEYGLYFQDDWKISRNFTLNLGIRYDLYVRHNELNDLATTFLKGPGSALIDDIDGTDGSTGSGQLQDANIQAGLLGCTTALQLAQAQIAGICGPGGFAASANLGAGDHNNFGPRLGFAWDVFGNGTTSLRGGMGVSYEGTLYNPLSNSRWNLPHYSFNEADNFLAGDVSNILYGPAGVTGSLGTQAGCPACTITPTFTGAGSNPGQGVGAQAEGNLTGWDATNANLAFLTGIIFPEGIKDPYVYNWFFGFQRELAPKWVVEVNYVGTAGHKLFRAESINRIPGMRLPVGVCLPDNSGRTNCGQPGGRINPNYGTLRNWQNVVNSNYHSLQASLRKRMGHGFQFQANYTWSHSIDGGSTWHSGATSSNGPAGGEGYTSDQTNPGLDRSNSVFDIRQRFVVNYVWEMPFFKGRGGAAEAILGGWQINGVFSAQTGNHWSPWDSRARAFSDINAGNLIDDCAGATFNPAFCINAGGDYNLDRAPNDRPDSTIPGFGAGTHDMWANGFGSAFSLNTGGIFSTPCLGCNGTLGRNTFVGPGFWGTDLSIFKTFKITERVNLQFRSEFFNILNRTNFQTPGNPNNRVNSTQFGQASTAFQPRQIQFGLKLSF